MPAARGGARTQYHCSFCGKSQEQVRRLIAGPGAVYICDECVQLCREILEDESVTTPARAKIPAQRLPPPRVICDQLGEYVVGQARAKILDVPFTIADATALTEAGYVGEDVENILLRLIQAADYDVGRAERGIIYIDEIDKIARKTGDNPSIPRDASGEGVKQAL